MLSLGRMQQLKAIFLFSHGELAQPPEFDGFAIGDTLLENYALTKLACFQNQRRPDSKGQQIQ